MRLPHAGNGFSGALLVLACPATWINVYHAHVQFCRTKPNSVMSMSISKKKKRVCDLCKDLTHTAADEFITFLYLNLATLWRQRYGCSHQWELNTAKQYPTIHIYDHFSHLVIVWSCSWISRDLL